jgi:hypothetical protein
MSTTIDIGYPSRIDHTATAVYYGCQPFEPDPPQPVAPDRWFPGPTIHTTSPPPDGEFAIMAAIEKLDAAAQRRVLAWLRALVAETP